MQDASNQLGPAALDLIQTTMPVFNAPWHVKEALEAAGVPQLTSTTPSRLRSATFSRTAHMLSDFDLPFIRHALQ